LYTDSAGGSTDAVARHVSNAQITCCFYTATTSTQSPPVSAKSAGHSLTASVHPSISSFQRRPTSVAFDIVSYVTKHRALLLLLLLLSTFGPACCHPARFSAISLFTRSLRSTPD